MKGWEDGACLRAECVAVSSCRVTYRLFIWAADKITILQQSLDKGGRHFLQTYGVSLGPAFWFSFLRARSLARRALIYGDFYGSRGVLIGNGYQWGWAVITSSFGGGRWREGEGGSEWIATLMHFPLPCNLCTSISRTISPSTPFSWCASFLIATLSQ